MKMATRIRGKTGMAAIAMVCVLLFNFSGFAATATADIGAEKATSIALGDAKIAAKDAIVEKCELDSDDGVRHYDIELYSAGYEYEYEIHAKTGEVLEKEKERDDDWAKRTQKTTKPAASVIGKEKAKELALSHAGVTAKDAAFTEVKLERDDGVLEYKLAFYCGGYEYEYQLLASSGKVLDWERDRDDDWDDRYDNGWYGHHNDDHHVRHKRYNHHNHN